MKEIKNIIIVTLIGLLAVSMFVQPAQSAGKSKEAKIVEYQLCLHLWTKDSGSAVALDTWIKECAKYRP